MPAPEAIAGFYSRYFTHDAIPATAKSREAGRLAWRERISASLRWPFERLGARAWAVRAGLRLLLPRTAQTIARSYAFLTPAAAGRSALDYGCGNGDLVRRMTAIGVRARGTDFDGMALAACRRAGLDVLEIDDCPSLPAQSLDLLTCMNVIEHVPDPDATLTWFRQVLHPQGSLLIETPNADAWLARALGPGWRGLEVPRHLNVFTLEGLHELLHRNGFEVVRSQFVPAAGFMAAASRTTPRKRRWLRMASPLIDLAGWGRPARREVLFLEARPRA
ncbi:MAG: class I SAM-dependent methyltransferase [Aquincola sp.]|nr:class I SAM-dependent methyltransferase [Aquincola sp.]